VEFTKEDVLNRKELPMSEKIDHAYFIYEGDYPNNQFWDGGVCYVPVRYKQVRHKLRVNIKRAESE